MKSIAWILGAAIAVIALMLAYGLAMPEYRKRAIETRQVCEKIAAAEDCRRSYERAIADAESRGEK